METKKWFKSKRFWGILITVLSGILKATIPAKSELIDQSAEVANNVVNSGILEGAANVGVITGVALNVFGQLVAKQPLIKFGK